MMELSSQYKVEEHFVQQNDHIDDKGGDEEENDEKKIDLKDDPGSNCRSSVKNCSSNMYEMIERTQDSIGAYYI